MKCLETRRTKEGLRRRRYRTDDNRTFWTVEVPDSVLCHVTSQPRLRAALEAWKRAQATAARRVRVEALLAQDWKPLAVAEEVGMAVRSIQQIRQDLELRKRLGRTRQS